MFEIADAYEVMMGRWSRQLAPLFVDFAGVQEGERVLDVGCGTGSLSATLARVTKTSEIVGIDPSTGFIEYARTQTTDSRVTFELGDALKLPYPDDSFDRCMALLVMDHISRCSQRRGRNAPGHQTERCRGDHHVGSQPRQRALWVLLGCRGSFGSDGDAVVGETCLVRVCGSPFKSLGGRRSGRH